MPTSWINLIPIGVLLAGTTALVGFYLTRSAATVSLSQTSSPSVLAPVDTPAPAFSPEPSPSISSSPFNAATPLNTPTPRNFINNPPKQTFTPVPSIAPATPDPADNTLPAPEIVFLNLPPSVPSGEPFTVQWAIRGPNGQTGDKTTLRVEYNVDSASDGASSSVHSNTNQSFGPFVIPRTYSVQLNYSGSGQVQLTASATVNGRSISVARTVQLEG